MRPGPAYGTLAASTGAERASPWSHRLAYVPAFDGIRAIAVIAVLLFHAGVEWIPGGFLGVDTFFVLSGFLITSILLGEMGAYRRISFGRFYLGRARRLMPALIAVLVFTALLSVLLAHDAAARVREDSIAALFYVTNWWNVFNDQSYFEAVGRPPMLQHLWSLAVEEQFYLVWPSVLFVAYRWRGRTGVGRVALAGAAVSTLAMLVLGLALGMPADRDPSRLYFGSDTHAMGVLLGAALATYWRPSRLPRTLPVRPRLILVGGGALALLGMAWFFHVIDEDSAVLYRGGFLVFSCLTAVVIAIASHPALLAFRWLGWQPLRYLGTRSYGLYLWHWPVFMVLRPGVDIDWLGTRALVLQLGVTAALAELSFRFVEMPVRRGALGRAWYRWRAGEFSLTSRRFLVGEATALVVAFAIGIALWTIPAPSANDYLGGVTEVGSAELVPVPSPSGMAPASGVPTPARTFSPGPAVTRGPITAVGDSVMLGARDELRKGMPKITIDAAISRQADVVSDRISERLAASQLADVVVIHTGTNGPAYASILMPLLRKLRDRSRVVLVTNRAPDPWIDSSNRMIAGVAREFPNVRLADWAEVSAGRRSYFYADGTHTTPEGSRAYAQVIAAALTTA